MTDTPEFFDEETLLEMVENQLADGHPLQVKATLMRLVMKGTPREEALQYIACALGAELMAMEAEQGPFNLVRYGEFLDSLPEMPWAECPGPIRQAPAPAIIITATTNDGSMGICAGKIAVRATMWKTDASKAAATGVAACPSAARGA